MCFTLGAALLKHFKSSLVCAGQRDGEAVRNQIIPGVTSSDFDLVGLAAEAHNIVCENNFSFCHTKIESFRKERRRLREGRCLDRVLEKLGHRQAGLHRLRMVRNGE